MTGSKGSYVGHRTSGGSKRPSRSVEKREFVLISAKERELLPWTLAPTCRALLVKRIRFQPGRKNKNVGIGGRSILRSALSFRQESPKHLLQAAHRPVLRPRETKLGTNVEEEIQ